MARGRGLDVGVGVGVGEVAVEAAGEGDEAGHGLTVIYGQLDIRHTPNIQPAIKRIRHPKPQPRNPPINLLPLFLYHLLPRQPQHLNRFIRLINPLHNRPLQPLYKHHRNRNKLGVSCSVDLGTDTTIELLDGSIVLLIDLGVVGVEVFGYRLTLMLLLVLFLVVVRLLVLGLLYHLLAVWHLLLVVF